jgi:DNA-binding NarL/FixJ family response regulator
VRGRAYGLLGSVRCDTDSLEVAVELYERALQEPGASPELLAEVHQKLAWVRFAAGETEAARRHAQAAVRLAAGDASIAAPASATAAQVEVARTGRVPRRLLGEALALDGSARVSRPSMWIETGPSILEGVVLLWAGELEEASEPLQRTHAAAVEGDDPWLLTHSLAYLSALETGLGRPRRGLELARRYLDMASETGLAAQRAGGLWPYAAAAAWLDRPDKARSAAEEVVEIALRTGHRLYLIGGLATLGGIELSVGRARAAAAALERARELARQSGIVPLGRFGILPDAVEAAVALGDLERAEEIAGDLTACADRLARPWALALAARCAGLVAAAHDDWDTMESAFARALVHHGDQPRVLPHARTQLVFGRCLRRAGRKRDARVTLEDALETFRSAGATSWAERAGEQLRRIGGRQTPARGELSATEAKIAELVARGRSNAEAAAELQLSPRTVEWNLSKIYRKLAVRSRSELAASLRANPGVPVVDSPAPGV